MNFDKNELEVTTKSFQGYKPLNDWKDSAIGQSGLGFKPNDIKLSGGGAYARDSLKKRDSLKQSHLQPGSIKLSNSPSEQIKISSEDPKEKGLRKTVKEMPTKKIKSQMIEEDNDENEEQVRISEKKYIVKSKVNASSSDKNLTKITSDMFVKEPDLGLQQIKMYGMYRVFHEM